MISRSNSAIEAKMLKVNLPVGVAVLMSSCRLTNSIPLSLPVFGRLVQHYGLRNMNVLGKSGAHKVMLMAAVAFNIRKYMRNMPKKSVSMAIAMEREQQHAPIISYWLTPTIKERSIICLFRIKAARKSC